MTKIWFVGTGPGDLELITLKAQRLIQQADAILFDSSKVAAGVTEWAKTECEVVDAKEMSLAQMNAWLLEKAQNKDVVCLLPEDPVLYSSLIELFPPLDAVNIEVGIVPGVLSATAAPASAREALLLSGLTETLIFTHLHEGIETLEGESLQELAQHQTALYVQTSASSLGKIQKALLTAGWDDDAAVLVGCKAGRSNEEKIIRGTLTDIREKCEAEKIESPIVFIASPSLGGREWPEIVRPKTHKTRNSQ